MKKKITIYTSKTCNYCDQVKKVLTENSVEFTGVDIVEYRKEWEKVISLTATATTPTVKINNEFVLPGRDFYNEQNLLEIISSFEKSTYSDARRALELIKTLNYNTYTAFNRLNNTLQQIENKLNTEENEHKSTR